MLVSPISPNYTKELKNICSPLPNSVPMCLLRTWSNGWFTSTRLHEPKILPCIFGCDAGDCLHHYLECEVLWTLVYCGFNCNVSIFVNSSNSSRACINCPKSCDVSYLYTAYSTYHSLRKLHSESIHNAISSNEFHSMHLHALELISLFKADTRYP